MDTDLFYCARHGLHSQVMRIRNQPQSMLNPDDEDEIGFTALHWACSGGHVDVAKYLIATGSTIDKVCGLIEWTPLHVACRVGNLNIVELLLMKKADVNSRTLDGDTPLSLAVYHGNRTVAEVLLKEGANYDTLTDLLHIAARTGQLWALYVLSGMPPPDIDIFRRRNNDMFDWAIANVNHKAESSGYTPLHEAVSQSHPDCVQFLAQKLAANLETPLEDGRMPLFVAVSRNNAALVDALCDSGVNIMAENESGSTALHEAVFMGFGEVVDVLMKHGAKPKHKNGYGLAPLSICTDPMMKASLLGLKHLIAPAAKMVENHEVNDSDQHGCDSEVALQGTGQVEVGWRLGRLEGGDEEERQDSGEKGAKGGGEELEKEKGRVETGETGVGSVVNEEGEGRNGEELHGGIDADGGGDKKCERPARATTNEANEEPAGTGSGSPLDDVDSDVEGDLDTPLEFLNEEEGARVDDRRQRSERWQQRKSSEPTPPTS